MDTLSRSFGRALAATQYTNFYTGQTETVFPYIADSNAIHLLHLVTADPYRLPTLIAFNNPNFDSFSSSGPSLTTGFPWYHGSIAPEINNIWLGLVGPGVRNDKGKGGLRTDIWSDHTDIRPTMLALLGLKDSYQQQGRVLIEALYDWAVPQTLVAHRETLIRLGEAYKQLNAPLGQFPQAALRFDTTAIASGISANDNCYVAVSATLQNDLIPRHDQLVSEMEEMLSKAAFDNQAIDEQAAKKLIQQSEQLIKEAEQLAVTGCSS